SALLNARNSTLLRLPAELRCEIYSYVLTEPDGTFTFNAAAPDYSGRPSTGYTLDIAATNPHRLALLSTCLQTYKECSHLPFTLNGRLRFLCLWSFHRTVVLRLLLAQRSAITELEIADKMANAMTQFFDHTSSFGIQELKNLLPNIRSVTLR
ncbi:hypothetical protein CC86DRAFT_275290, partial [Ophiobolus disseminans]